MAAGASARKRERARERHREPRYCTPCGIKGRAGDPCPQCGGSLTPRTSGWRDARYGQAGERTAVREEAAPDGLGLMETWLADQPGMPLGAGMPSGAPLRLDGESHSNAWRRILRADPCAYCGALTSETVDHIEPRFKRRRGTERWVNLIGACPRCNGQKAAKPLLLWLLAR